MMVNEVRRPVAAAEESAVQPPDQTDVSGRKEVSPTTIPDRPPRSSARALLKHAGQWVGTDLEERLREVYAARGKAEF